MDQDSRRTGRPARRTGWVSFHRFFLSLNLLHLNRTEQERELIRISLLSDRPWFFSWRAGSTTDSPWMRRTRSRLFVCSRSVLTSLLPLAVIFKSTHSNCISVSCCCLVGRTEMGSLLPFGRGGQEPLPTGLPLFAQDHQGLIEEANLDSMAKVGEAPEKGRTR
jgi:hypothetical protein